MLDEVKAKTAEGTVAEGTAHESPSWSGQKHASFWRRLLKWLAWGCGVVVVAIVGILVALFILLANSVPDFPWWHGLRETSQSPSHCDLFVCC